jgi:hypothetical protein
MIDTLIWFICVVATAPANLEFHFGVDEGGGGLICKIIYQEKLLERTYGALFFHCSSYYSTRAMNNYKVMTVQLTDLSPCIVVTKFCTVIMFVIFIMSFVSWNKFLTVISAKSCSVHTQLCLLMQ